MTSYHDKGQLFGTDGRVTWTEPELSMGEDYWLEAAYEEACEIPDDDFGYSDATGDYGQWD